MLRTRELPLLLFQHAPQLNPFPPAEGSWPGGSSPGRRGFRPPALPPPLTSAGDQRAPDVRSAAAGRSGHGACCGRRREGRGRAAESPPPSRGEGRERNRRGGGGGARAGCGPTLTLARRVGWVGDPCLTLGRGARAELVGSPPNGPDPDGGPTAALGLEKGEGRPGLGAPWGRLSCLMFP